MKLDEITNLAQQTADNKVENPKNNNMV